MTAALEPSIGWRGAVIGIGVVGIVTTAALMLLGGAIEEGNKVKLTMMFRGRQITHPELGLEVLRRVTAALVELGKVESQPNMEGRVMSMVVAPIKSR